MCSLTLCVHIKQRLSNNETLANSDSNIMAYEHLSVVSISIHKTFNHYVSLFLIFYKSLIIFTILVLIAKYLHLVGETLNLKLWHPNGRCTADWHSPGWVWWSVVWAEGRGSALGSWGGWGAEGSGVLAD